MNAGFFTFDIYKSLMNKNTSEHQSVKIDRVVAMIALVIAMAAAKPLLGGLDQAFQNISTEFFGCSLRNLGSHSIFLLIFLLGFSSVIMFTNGTSTTKDDKAYDIDLKLFETIKSFFFGAMGIAVIIVALYAIFW